MWGWSHALGADPHLGALPYIWGSSPTPGGSQPSHRGLTPHLGVSPPTGWSHPTLTGSHPILMGLPHISGTGTNKVSLTELQCVGPNVTPPLPPMGVLWVSMGL